MPQSETRLRRARCRCRDGRLAECVLGNPRDHPASLRASVLQRACCRDVLLTLAGTPPWYEAMRSAMVNAWRFPTVESGSYREGHPFGRGFWQRPCRTPICNGGHDYAGFAARDPWWRFRRTIGSSDVREEDRGDQTSLSRIGSSSTAPQGHNHDSRLGEYDQSPATGDLLE